MIRYFAVGIALGFVVVGLMVGPLYIVSPPHYQNTSVVTITRSTTIEQVTIPKGIADVAAHLQFSPENLTVIIGVNNTIMFRNADTQEHIIEGLTNPYVAGGSFQFYSLPGSLENVTLTTPGIYYYFCEWHPIWMDGYIVVKA